MMNFQVILWHTQLQNVQYLENSENSVQIHNFKNKFTNKNFYREDKEQDNVQLRHKLILRRR